MGGHGAALLRQRDARRLGTARRFACATVADETNYVFQYPFAGTPCFLLKLGRPVEATATPAGARTDRRTSGAAASGRRRSIVAFSAICAHKLAYPTRDVSFIRYQRQPSTNSVAPGASIAAPSTASTIRPRERASFRARRRSRSRAILLEYDAAQDTLAAVGTLGAEQFDAFFRKYEFKLAMEYGEGKARRPVGGRRSSGARAVLPPDDPVLTSAPTPRSSSPISPKSYGAVEAVKGISFAVRAGTTTALLGGNGAGKTTTLSMLLGVLTPTRRARSRCWARTCPRTATACCRG